MVADADRPVLLHSRAQILFTALVAAAAAGIAFLPCFPFDPRFSYIALFSSAMHFLLLAFFHRATRGVLTVYCFVNIVLMGFVMHFTGGVASPFVLVFIFILIAMYYAGLRHPLLLPSTIATYAAVVLLEYAGVIDAPRVSSVDIYQCGWITLFVLLSISGFLGISGSIYDLILRELRGRVEADQLSKQNLLRKMAELEASSQVGAMVAKIAHDINGPVTAIRGFLELLAQDKALDAETQEDCRLIITESQRIADMTNRMVRYVRHAPAKANERISLVRLMEDILAVIQFHPLAHGVRFEKTYPPPGEGLDIMGQKGSLQQVYFNIVKNAVEAIKGQESRVVRVVLEKSQGHCQVAVVDNGPGMAEDVLKKVRLGYYTTKPGGTGLGLMIVRELLEMHEGTMDIQSIPRKGTCVLTRLPLVQTEKNAEEEAVSLLPRGN